MPIINYKDLKKYLAELGNHPFAPVYLVYGEEMLTKNAFDELLDALIPAVERNVNYEPLDGTQETIHEVIGRVNTYSLLPGIKVIALRDAKIFSAGQKNDPLLDNAKKIDDDDGSIKKDDSQALQLAVEKGFPANNHLVITTDMADKRRSLFKVISNKGVVIDCSVPQGDRRADRVVQESVLAERMKALLTAGNKSMGQSTYLALYEMTGFDLRVFSSNLGKLISYVGDRTEITISDVESVLQRTKKDPIYELTNALADRKPGTTLFFLDSILSSGIHPLQVFTALINQVRKLLLVRDFAESPYGSDWQAACSYDYFQKRVIPAIVEYDRNLLDYLSGGQAMLDEETNSQKAGARSKTKKKTAQPMTDLLIAKNPKNAYPIYLLLKKSERFSKEELINAFDTLHEADNKLKTGGQNPRLVLEKIILEICKVPVSRQKVSGVK